VFHPDEIGTFSGMRKESKNAAALLFLSARLATPEQAAILFSETVQDFKQRKD
jgi:hypothetical protein